jgi:hypothetical protein
MGAGLRTKRKGEGVSLNPVAYTFASRGRRSCSWGRETDRWVVDRAGVGMWGKVVGLASRLKAKARALTAQPRHIEICKYFTKVVLYDAMYIV